MRRLASWALSPASLDGELDLESHRWKPSAGSWVATVASFDVVVSGFSIHHRPDERWETAILRGEAFANSQIFLTSYLLCSPTNLFISPARVHLVLETYRSGFRIMVYSKLRRNSSHSISRTILSFAAERTKGLVSYAHKDRKIYKDGDLGWMSSMRWRSPFRYPRARFDAGCSVLIFLVI